MFTLKIRKSIVLLLVAILTTIFISYGVSSAKEEPPKGTIIAEKKFQNVTDIFCYLTLERAAPPGPYYIEMTDVVNKWGACGWKIDMYPDGTAWQDGAPLEECDLNLGYYAVDDAVYKNLVPENLAITKGANAWSHFQAWGDHTSLGQSFIVPEYFGVVGLQISTWGTNNSGGKLTLYSQERFNGMDILIGQIPGVSFRVPVVMGHYGYIVGPGDDGAVFRVIDVSTPSALSEIASCRVFPAEDIEITIPKQTVYSWGNVRWWAWDIAVVGNYAYLVEPIKGGSIFRIIDLSTPSRPSEIGSCRTHGWAWSVTVVDKYAYIADGHGLCVVDVSKPSTPSEVGFYQTPTGYGNGVIDVAVVDNYAYIADMFPSFGLWVVDISIPSAPSEIGSYQTSGEASSVTVVGNYAYMADGYSGLCIVDVSTPSAPSEIGVYQTLGFAHDVTIVDNYAYIVEDKGLHIVDVSTPSSPSKVYFFQTPGEVYHVSVSNDLIYVIDYGGGVSILRYTGAIPTFVESFGKLSTTWGKMKADLYQNYPNPFNPETWIPFQLSTDANMIISIYDIHGQLVRKIGLGEIPAGVYVSKDKAIHWNGRNDMDEKVASGIYYYNLQAGDYSATKRMLIVK